MIIITIIIIITSLRERETKRKTMGKRKQYNEIY